MDLAFEEKGSAVKLLLSRQPLEVLHTRIGSRTYCYGYGIPSSSIHLPNISYGHYDEHRNRNGDLWTPGKCFGKAPEGTNTAFPQTSVNRVNRRTDAADLQCIPYMLR